MSPPLTLDPSFLASASFYVKTPDPHRMSNKRLSCVGGFTKPQRCGPIENPSLQQWWLSRNTLRVANDMYGMKGLAVIARPWSP
jgi:hypothetical protein